MYNDFAGFQKYFQDKKVLIVGMGISNTPLIDLFLSFGVKVTVADLTEKEEMKDIISSYRAKGVHFQLGKDYLSDLSYDVIFKTPGMRYDTEELVRARKAGTVVTSEMEEFFKICPAKIIAVTGSDGKTTTTTLIDLLLRKQGYTCHLGGNIGKPILARIGEIKPEDYVVLEISSFQLHTMRQSPHIAVVTNVSPNHLDMHKDYQEYIDAKKNIFRYQKPDDILVSNLENEVTRAFLQEAPGKTVSFSRKGRADICLAGNEITVFGTPVLNIAKIKIPGMFNVENFMAAIGAVYEQVDCDTIKKVAQSFGGVPHRCEFVREFNGVKFYNSSIDSSPNRTINTLKIFPAKKIVLIAGGKDKGIAYDEIGPAIAERVKTLVLIGKTAEKINEAVVKTGEKVDTVFADSYENAVKTAYQSAKCGDVVLLSPASTSFDLFRNFEERGNLFQKLVNELR